MINLTLQTVILYFRTKDLIWGDGKQILNISHIIVEKIEELMRSKKVKGKKKNPSDMSLVGYQIILTQSLLIKQEVDLMRKYMEPVLPDIMNPESKYLNKEMIEPNVLRPLLKKFNKQLLGLGKKIALSLQDLYKNK